MLFTILFFVSCFSAAVSEPLKAGKAKPIVLWHGINDDCCNPESLGKVQDHIKKMIPGVFVLSLMIGKDREEDKRNSLYLDPNQQIRTACDIIASQPELQEGYNAVGFSQGAQFLRGVAQRCPSPPMLTLVSMGGQHQGIYGVPPSFKCPGCEMLVRKTNVVNWGTALKRLVPAHMWHDPLDEKSYRRNDRFIAEINNEFEIKPSYKANLMKLENLVLVKFENDEMVIPKESSWFEFYKSGQAEEIVPLRNSLLYRADRLGLRALDEAGKLHLISEEFNHLHFSEQWFTANIIDRFLFPTDEDSRHKDSQQEDSQQEDSQQKDSQPLQNGDSKLPRAPRLQRSDALAEAS